ncbi:MAG: adenosine deaminase [Psychrilyobacter sp.]|uniref:adenosine deaminase n=1 Tax=Psychrilyobacter sp. TaxID=2586924 RepID=UPI003C7642AD
MSYKEMPKIDLHCHLDGSLRAETVLDIIKKNKLELTQNLEDIKEWLTAPLSCASLDEYLRSFDLPIAIMQSKEDLERVSFELMEDAALENIKYIEVRFAPQQHMENGLTTKEIIESVLRGMRRAEKKYDIKGNYILSCMRHLSAESAMKIVEEGRMFIGKGVEAVDLCGGEVAGFCHKFIDPMKKAKEYGYRITIHAGETGIGQNVVDAIELLGAERIGHGVFITNSEKAYNLVKERKIPLEICPTSNVQTKAVKNYEEHPIYDFHNDEIVVTLNTDNRTVSNTTMTEEYVQIEKSFKLKKSEYTDIYLNSVEAAFISEDEKQRLRGYLK